MLPLRIRFGPAFVKNLAADWLFFKARFRRFWRLSKKYDFGVFKGSFLFSVNSGALDMASSSSIVYSILGNGIRGVFISVSWLFGPGLDISPCEESVGVGDSSMSCKMALIFSSLETDRIEVDPGALADKLGKLDLQSSCG